MKVTYLLFINIDIQYFWTSFSLIILFIHYMYTYNV